jgi:sugar diacid utilization regulator
MYNHELEVRLRAELLAHLLSPVDELRGAACQELAIQWRPRAYVLVTLHQLTGELDLGAAIGLMASRGAAGSVLAMARDDHLAVLLPDGRSDEPERETSRFISVLAKAGSVWVAGISEPHVRLGSAPLAYRQALLAARVASLTQPTSGVCSWDSLGAYTTLVQLPPDSIEQALDPRIIPLASEDYRDLLATAEAYLDGACDAARAAAQLHVHRGTVYYRLKQITAISGFDLDDGMDRLALHMAVKLLRMGPLTP